MDFDRCLNGLPLPTQGANRGYSPGQLIKQFMCSVWCGVNRFEHTEVTWADEVVRQLWGFQHMGRAIRTDRYRLAEWKEIGAEPQAADIESYDYNNGPVEQRNIAEEKPGIIVELRFVLYIYPEAVTF